MRRLQALYYLATGLWPLVSMRSFEAVTGRKTDRWLVRMVGLLAAAIGLSLAVDRTSASSRVLGATSALAFAAIDVTYVAKRRIRPIYLGDAAVEAALVLSWLVRAHP